MLIERLIPEDQGINGGDRNRVKLTQAAKSNQEIVREHSNSYGYKESNITEKEAAAGLIDRVDTVGDATVATVGNVTPKPIEVEKTQEVEPAGKEVTDGGYAEFDVDAFLRRIKANPELAKVMATSIDKWEKELFEEEDIASEFNFYDEQTKEKAPNICPSTPPPPEPPPGSLLSELARPP
jgi:hypothetical protein